MRGVVFALLWSVACFRAPVVPEVDGGTADLIGKTRCEVIEQMNCGANERCDLDRATYDTTTQSGICTANGTKKLGEACDDSGADPCVRGADCQRGYCRQFCKADDNCANLSTVDGDSICDVSPFIDGPLLCTLVCAPFATTSTCASGETCRVITSTRAAELSTDCRKNAETLVAEGALCTTVDDCAGGTSCAVANSEARCRKLCRVALGNADCAAPAQCNAMRATFGDMTVSSTRYGVCF